MESVSAIKKIQAEYNKLSCTEKRLADYVLKNSRKVIEFTVKDLAEASNVSEATVVRMCQHTGFKGYWAFRMALAKEVDRYQKDTESMEAENDLHGIFKKYSANMLSIADNIDLKTVNKCVELLRDCDQVHLIASGNTTPIIEHMGFRLGRLGIRNTFNGVADYYMNQINLAGENDILFAVSQSGSTKSVLDGVALARQKGLKVIAITAYKNSKLGELADYVLESKGDFSRFDFYKSYSHLCEMAVAEAVLDLLASDEKIKAVVQEKSTDTLEIFTDMKL